MNKTNIVIGLVVVAAAVVGGSIALRRGSNDSGALQIAVVPKGTTHDFWNAVLAGARSAASNTESTESTESTENVEILWTGPDREGDRERQIQIVEDFIVRRVDGIVLAPSDSKALVPVVERAAAANIPLVIIDSNIDSDRRVSFVATDNFQGGAIAARRMGKVLGGRGRVAVVKYMAGSSSTTARENGFMKTLRAEFPQIEIVDHRYGQDTVETALSAAEDMLTRNPELEGLFACNESTARGALRALESSGRAKNVTLVGFDSSEPLLDGLRAERIDSLVVQNPFRMGHDGVQAVLAAIEGRRVNRNIDTGVSLVTRENLETPEIQRLLNPSADEK